MTTPNYEYFKKWLNSWVVKSTVKEFAQKRGVLISDLEWAFQAGWEAKSSYLCSLRPPLKKEYEE